MCGGEGGGGYSDMLCETRFDTRKNHKIETYTHSPRYTLWPTVRIVSGLFYCPSINF